MAFAKTKSKAPSRGRGSSKAPAKAGKTGKESANGSAKVATAEEWASATKGLASSWKKVRDNKNEGGFSNIVPMDDGQYVAVLDSMECRVNKPKGGKGHGSVGVTLKFIVTDHEEYEGLQPEAFYYFPLDDGEKCDKSMEMLQKTLLRLKNEDGSEMFDLAALEVSDFPELASAVASEKAKVRIQIKNGIHNGKPTQNCYVNGMATAADD